MPVPYRVKKKTLCPECKLCASCASVIQYGLTRQEMVIVRKVCEGLSNKDIGRDLNISEETVKRHNSNIMDKMGVDNRTALAMMAVSRGWA